MKSIVCEEDTASACASFCQTFLLVYGRLYVCQVLETASVLSRSIRLRNPYVDALHVAQIALLRRYRALPDDAPPVERAALLDAIHNSINGIAAGLQTTG